jgi:hypothetical protein
MEMSMSSAALAGRATTMKGSCSQGVCLRALSALLALTCLVGCVGPGGATGLSKPRLALYRCLLHEKRLFDSVRELEASYGPVEVMPVPWGVVWLEKEGLFGVGRYRQEGETEAIAMAGTPMEAEWREVMLTPAEGARYFQLLLDGHTLEHMAKEMNFPEMDYLPWLRYYQTSCFLDWTANRRILGQEVLRTLVDAAEEHRGKPGWVEWRGELSQLAPELMDELAYVPVEDWPEWYRQNGGRLYWDPVTEKYKLQLELR